VIKVILTLLRIKEFGLTSVEKKEQIVLFRGALELIHSG
jgi:hypothetical protein